MVSKFGLVHPNIFAYADLTVAVDMLDMAP